MQSKRETTEYLQIVEKNSAKENLQVKCKSLKGFIFVSNNKRALPLFLTSCEKILGNYIRFASFCTL